MKKFRDDPKKSLLCYMKNLVTEYQIWHSWAMVVLCFFFFLNKKNLSDLALLGHVILWIFFWIIYFFYFFNFFHFIFHFIFFYFCCFYFLIGSDGPPYTTVALSLCCCWRCCSCKCLVDATLKRTSLHFDMFWNIQKSIFKALEM